MNDLEYGRTNNMREIVGEGPNHAIIYASECFWKI